MVGLWAQFENPNENQFPLKSDISCYITFDGD